VLLVETAVDRVLQAKSDRVQALDAARGIAMLLVCVAHFNTAYFERLPGREFEAEVLRDITLIASPTFITISGLLLGFLARTRPWGAAALRIKLMDRGLFMLTIGHVLIALAHAPLAGGIGPAFEWSFITDVIAVGVMIGPVLVDRVPPGRRLALAGGLYAFTWVVVATWRPESAGMQRAKEYLVGPSHFIDGIPRLVFDGFPLIPWLAVYVAATVLGENLGRRAAAGRGAEIIPRLARVAFGCVLTALLVKGVPLALKHAGLAPTSVLVWTLGWPLQKQPPAPAYLGVYAGLGLMLLCGLLAIDARPSLRRVLAVPALLGRTSLIMFLAQFLLYFSIFVWWSPPYTPLWPLLLLASLVVMVGVGVLWARFGRNDVFGVGYRWLVAAAPSTAASSRS
jgi:uncharacterized membrane protein